MTDAGTPIDPLLTGDDVNQRLAALQAELDRLQGDPSVFARAFHTRVAQQARAALLDLQARLAELATLDLTPETSAQSACISTVFDDQPWSTHGTRGRREILDV